MENDQIDILMATYNGEKYLACQLDSILNQTYSNFHLYISDDASNDSTPLILKEYEKKDSRITVILNNKNLGSSKNFENLLKKVKAKYFMFADQDDFWNEDKIEKSYNFLKSTKADLVFTDLEIVDENLNKIHSSFNRYKGYISKIKKCENTLELVYLYNVVTGCTIFCSSSFIDKVLPFPENKDIIHDHFIPLVIMSNGGCVKYLDEPTIKYRQHEKNQIGAKRYVDSLNDFESVRNHLIDVKISVLSTYIKEKERFDDNFVNYTKENIEYFEDIKSIKSLRLKGMKKYFKIYKNETIVKTILYLFMFHMPCISRALYKLIKK